MSARSPWGGCVEMASRGTIVVMRIALVFAALTLFGCAQQERDYIIGDESFTRDERIAIQAGKTFIENATGRSIPEIRWEPVPVGERNVIVRKSLDKDVGGDGAIGYFAIDLDAAQCEADGADLVAVAAHEFGHGLGLEHHVEAGLMNPMAARAWSDADEAECLAKGICR